MITLNWNLRFKLWKIKRILKWVWLNFPVRMKTHIDTIEAYTKRINEINILHEKELAEVTSKVQDLLKSYVKIDKDFGKDGKYGIYLNIDARLLENSAHDESRAKEVIAKELSIKVYNEIMGSKFISK